MTVANTHYCVDAVNSPDPLGEKWVILCACGIGTAPMLTLPAAVTLFGGHCIIASFDRISGVEHGRRKVNNPNSINDSGDGWSAFHRIFDRWAAKRTPQETPSARHYVNNPKGQ